MIYSRSMIAPGDVVVIRKTDPMVVFIDKGKLRASMNLLMRKAAYDTVRNRTVLPLQHIKETDMESRTRIMVRIPNKDG